jgi:HEAT repeat protein
MMISDEELLFYHYGDGLGVSERDNIAKALATDATLAARLKQLIAELDAVTPPIVAVPPASQQRWRAALANAANANARQSSSTARKSFWKMNPSFALAAVLSIAVGIAFWQKQDSSPMVATVKPAVADAANARFERSLNWYLSDTEQQLASIKQLRVDERAPVLERVLVQNRMYAIAADRADEPRYARTLRSFAPVIESISGDDTDTSELPRKKSSRQAPTDEESLALAAIEGLMSMPPERALPLIKKVLAGNQSMLVKERAFFVLSQFDSPEANALMLEHAKSAQSPLRQQAIRTIGIGGNKKTIAALTDIYTNGDASVKKEVLQAWMIAGSKAEVYQVAANAETEAEANDAIRMLAVMGAKDELRKLVEQKKSSRGLIEAFSISGDLEGLKRIATSAGETSLRIDAIRGIGVIGNNAAKTALREIYTSNNDAQLKDAALHGMLISGDEQGVLTLYRNAKTADEKRSLLKMLTMMGGDAAMQAIDAALEGKK